MKLSTAQKRMLNELAEPFSVFQEAWFFSLTRHQRTGDSLYRLGLATRHDSGRVVGCVGYALTPAGRDASKGSL